MNEHDPVDDQFTDALESFRAEHGQGIDMERLKLMLREIWDDALASAERERPEVAQQLREFVDAGARIRCEPVDDQGISACALGTGKKQHSARLIRARGRRPGAARVTPPLFVQSTTPTARRLQGPTPSQA